MFTVLDVPFLVLGLYLFITSWIDIKSHEVPDWLTYSLVALGISFAAVMSFFLRDLTVVWSVVGALLGFGLGAALYYTAQWGGGDAKLLAGVGAILGFNATWLVDVWNGIVPIWKAPAFAWFLVLTLVGGALYGVVWMFVLIIQNRKRFIPAFTKRLATLRWQRITALAITGLLLCVSLWVGFTYGASLALPVIGLAALIYVAFYLAVAVQLVETTLMRKRVKAKQLTEGDWVIGGLNAGKTVIIADGTVSVSREEIALATKKAPNTLVTVKSGIPFVPSFFIAYVALFILAQV